MQSQAHPSRALIRGERGVTIISELPSRGGRIDLELAQITLGEASRRILLDQLHQSRNQLRRARAAIERATHLARAIAVIKSVLRGGKEFQVLRSWRLRTTARAAENPRRLHRDEERARKRSIPPRDGPLHDGDRWKC